MVDPAGLAGPYVAAADVANAHAVAALYAAAVTSSLARRRF